MPGGFGFGPPPRLGRGPRGILTEEEKRHMPKITKTMVKRVFSYLKPYHAQFALVFAAILVASVLGLVPSLLTKQIVDTALPQKNLSFLSLLIGFSFGATVVLNLLGVLQNYINAWISQHIIYDMKNEMYNHVQGMGHRFFTTEKQGEIITRMTSDISGVQSVVSGTLSSAVGNVFTLAATLAALFSMNWKLALLSIVTVPLFVIPTKKVGKTRWEIVSKSQEKADEINQILNETLSVSGSLLVKLFTREKREYGRFSALNHDTVKLNIRENMAGQWFRMVIGVVTTIGPMLIYLVGGILIAHGDPTVTVGTIIAVVTLLNRLYMPVTQLLDVQVEIIRSMALFERIFDYLDRPQEIRSLPGATKLARLRGDIVFDHVSFAYDKKVPVLRDVSFHISPGAMFALVGPSGAGKTTITNLIPRLYDATQGAVRVDGTDVREIDLSSLRAAVGVVTQDSYLFNGTVRENLLYAREDAAQEELERACKAANIHDFIVSLPEGYNTLVGNRGVKLSGGEKQRISIARVILKNPSILILDEATSSLDSISEKAIQDAIGPLLSGRTSLVIAHRLSTILAADRILVVKDGAIVESGTHEQLLQQNGVYRRLYDTQFRKSAPSALPHDPGHPAPPPVDFPTPPPYNKP